LLVAHENAMSLFSLAWVKAGVKCCQIRAARQL
jgi:hypothetical protein